MFSSALVALALASSALAELSFTAPTASIGFVGGQPANITWTDSPTGVPLSGFGPAKASIYAGNSASQTSILTIQDSIDVTTLFLTFTPDPSIGPNSDQYFIRFESLTVKDPNTPTNPLLAFSHQFSMTGMTGTFSAQVLSEIAGQSTAPIGGVAPTSTPATGANSASNTPKPSSPSSSTNKSGAPSGSASKSAQGAAVSGKSAAVPMIASKKPGLWVGIVTGLVGAVIGASLL